MVNINIKFSNKTLYLLIGILTLLAVAGVAIATDPAVHGHINMDPLYIIGDNVGIGTGDPSATLDVVTPHARLNSASIVVESKYTGGNREGIGFLYWLNDVGTTFKTITEFSGTNKYDSIVLDRGDVGIGTYSMAPGLKLDVAGQVGATKYCDGGGNNCYTTTEMASSGSGGGDITIIYQDFPTTNQGTVYCPADYKAIAGGAQMLSKYGCDGDRITGSYPVKSNPSGSYNGWYVAWRCVHPRVYVTCMK